MSSLRKILSFSLILAYVGAAVVPAPALAKPMPMACKLGACHCKSMKPGQACCCLMMKKMTKLSWHHQKGEPPCFNRDCGQPLAALGFGPNAKPELAPQKAGLSLYLKSKFSRFASRLIPSSLPASIPDKVPLPA